MFRSVRSRLLLAAVTVEAIMLTLMVVSGLRVLSQSLAEQAQAHAAQLISILHASLVTPLAQHDYATVQAILGESHAVNGLLYIAVEDRSGQVVGLAGLKAGALAPPVDDAYSLDDDDGVYDTRTPITFMGQNLGSLQFGLDLSPVTAAWRRQFGQALAIAVLEISLSIALLTWIGMRLTQRLTRFTQVSEAVARGDYEHGPLEEGDDDVGRLGAAFNTMSRAVSQRVGELTVAIQRRDEVEAELRNSEARFRDLVGSASDWFWETDDQYRLTFASDRIANVLGVKPAAIFGLSWLEIGEDGSAGEHGAAVAAHQAFRDVVVNIGAHGAKDYKSVRLSALPLVDDDGQFLGYRGVGADITREIAAEKRAERAQQQLLDAIESLVDAIAVFDAQDRLVLCNSSYKTAINLGCDADLTGRSFRDILADAHARHVFEILNIDFETWLEDRVVRHNAADGHVFLVRTTDGRWLQSREFRTREGGVVAVRTDISQLKRREQELDALKRLYELILESVGDGIIGLDPSGMIIFANRSAASLLRHADGDLVSRPVRSLFCPDDPQDEMPWIAAACRHGVAASGQGGRMRLADGGEVPVDYVIDPLQDGSSTSGAVLMFRDATLRQQYEWTIANQQERLAREVAERTMELQREVEVRSRTEVALRSSRQRMKAITDSLVEGVVVVDRAGHLAFANPSARQLLECDPLAELEFQHIDDFLRLRSAEGDLDFAASPWRWVGDGRPAPQDNDATFVLASGRTLPVAYACAPLVDDDVGSGIIISFRDIAALKLAQKEAQQAARLSSIGQLAAGIAHEINTPIQYIGDNLRYMEGALPRLNAAIAAGRSLLEAMGASPTGDDSDALSGRKIERVLAELPQAIAESLDGVAHIARIVLSMKEFSHPGTTAKVSTNINQALDSTLTVSRNAWKHVARVETDFAADLPLVVCHAGEINQVFLNLILNAAQAIEDRGKSLPGRIRITTRQDGAWVEIRVADSGGGVPAAIRERIFDPFFTTKPVGKGTGQGLAICRDVIDIKHGGSLDVESVEGVGATFIIRLPIAGTTEADHEL